MDVFLIRHAHAVDLFPDHARTLSDRGREQVRTLARFLKRSESFSPDEFWHSPYLRARETAELLASELESNVLCREMPGLTPEDDPIAFGRTLVASKRSVAVVGHEPHLSALASLLVAGNDSPPVFAMKKGATLALERGGRLWVVRWHVYPDLLA